MTTTTCSNPGALPQKGQRASPYLQYLAPRKAGDLKKRCVCCRDKVGEVPGRTRASSSRARKGKQQRRKRVKRMETKKRQRVEEMLQTIAPGRGEGTIYPDDIDADAVKGYLSAEAKEKIVQNLNTSCRRRVERVTENIHRACNGYCDAEEGCPVNWRCAELLENLGGVRHDHMFAPWPPGGTGHR
ncbi:hypothetical protein Bbelb_051270 [Branchiostoma belcheri]|nr:hypothetical protein Bbelb_051270 [Branchiostoma belcheri]